ncbi:MAG TPA: rhodanese-like domain-containing protein, partial [Burkholderiales bacterium]|nr:rhodanese-like domain-containing protein [Burkholderiales bacterium]
MDDPKNAAAERARKMGLSYAGALLPAEAHALMEGGAKLVDVRTKPELLYVGKIPGAIAVEWQTYPGSRPNPEFLGELGA